MDIKVKIVMEMIEKMQESDLTWQDKLAITGMVWANVVNNAFANYEIDKKGKGKSSFNNVLNQEINCLKESAFDVREAMVIALNKKSDCTVADLSNVKNMKDYQ